MFGSLGIRVWKSLCRDPVPGNTALTLLMIMASLDLTDGTIGQVFVALLYHCANLSSRLVESKPFLRIRAVIPCLAIYGFDLQASRRV
jgi:hypothetical protein